MRPDHSYLVTTDKGIDAKSSICDGVADLVAKGCTYSRMTVDDGKTKTRFLIEGWLVRPDTEEPAEFPA